MSRDLKLTCDSDYVLYWSKTESSKCSLDFPNTSRYLADKALYDNPFG